MVILDAQQKANQDKSKQKRDEVKKSLEEIVSTLGGKGASQRVAEEIMEFMK